MTVSLRRLHLGRLMALAVMLALLPLPVLADDGPGKAAPGIRVSAAAIAQAKPLAASTAQSAQNAPPETSSPSFFKKPIGIAVLATFAAGVGYALYSTSNDRVHSPAKQ